MLRATLLVAVLVVTACSQRQSTATLHSSNPSTSPDNVNRQETDEMAQLRAKLAEQDAWIAAVTSELDRMAAPSSRRELTSVAHASDAAAVDDARDGEKWRIHWPSNPTRDAKDRLRTGLASRNIELFPAIAPEGASGERVLKDIIRSGEWARAYSSSTEEATEKMSMSLILVNQHDQMLYIEIDLITATIKWSALSHRQ